MVRRVDWLLITPTCLLLVLGLTVLQSVTPNLVFQQATIMAVGLLFLVFVSLINYQILASFSKAAYILTLILLIATVLIGQATRGSVRWIPLGLFNLQTSEIAKPLLIMFFARVLSSNPPKKFVQVIVSTMLIALPVFLIFRQPDLGSSLVLIFVWLGMMFVAGVPIRYFAIGAVVSAIFLPIGWHFLATYQKSRLTTFIDPLSDPLKSGYHLMQSIVAVGSGGLWGRGLGQGTQSQLRFLPESHTDFIFASLAEELGLVGSLLLLVLLACLLSRILRVSHQAVDKYGELISAGVFFMIAFQAFINIGMNIGLVPITGITLPLISFGGSSLLSTLLSLGLVASISNKTSKTFPFEIR